MRRMITAIALSALGGTATAADGPSAERVEDGFLEQSRSGLRGFTGWVASGVDSWFGDRPFEESGGRAYGKLRLGTLWRQDEGFDNRVRLRVRFDLPNLRDRAYIFFGQDNERDLVTDTPAAFTRERQLLEASRREDQTGFAGIGYAVRERLDLRAGVRGGYKPYVQARYRKHWQTSAAGRLEFRETLFWTSSRGLGANTALDYEYQVDPRLLVAWRNSAVVLRREHGVSWSSSLGGFYALDDRRQFSLELLANGDSETSVPVDEYGVRASWRQHLHQDWVIGELIVGHFWPREGGSVERSQSWAVGGSIELLF